ncbi:hypothetical protein GE09DRAFT_1267835 [Coniochaeta sp. 2T2.1]|nr:hypothetical protein GE09DRAFT_1267835 [Coniochaeta sp. 2T2.1]
MSTITHEDAVRLLEALDKKLQKALSGQATAFDQKLKDELRNQAELYEQKLLDKQVQADEHLNRLQEELGDLRRQFEIIEYKLVPEMGKAIHRTESTNQTVRGLTETQDDHETAIVSTTAKLHNLYLELARVYDYVTAQANSDSALALQDIRAQHERMAALMDEIEKTLARTNARHAKEGSIACNCAHTSINREIKKMGTRMSSIQKRITKSLKKQRRTDDTCTDDKSDVKVEESHHEDGVNESGTGSV